MKNLNILILILSVLLFTSCSKEEDIPVVVDPLTPGVLVLNEGQFGKNTASVTFKSTDGVIVQEFFKSTNQRALGDVLNSVMESDDAYYLVVNVSGKIEKVSKSDMKSIATYNGLTSPRYMVEHKDKGYISNLKFDTTDNPIDLFNLNLNQKENSISVQGWCEEMIVFENRIYIANTGKHQLLVADLPLTGDFEKYDLPKEPMNLKIDKNGMIWILCSGGYSYGQNQAALCLFNPNTKSVESVMKFSNPFAFPSELCIDASGEYLYFLSNGVYKMSITDTEIPKEPLIVNHLYFYGLGIDPKTNEIYVGDAMDAQSKGSVFVYSEMGTIIESFEVGYFPNGFIFR